jgi:predicted  nucleic acid-binding Zn ribbon protein
MKGVYKFYLDCGRMGHLDGLFVATSEEVNNVIDKKVYFGEVLGKHSEVYTVIKDFNIKLVSNSEEVVKIFEEHDISAGHNPLDYWEETKEIFDLED